MWLRDAMAASVWRRSHGHGEEDRAPDASRSGTTGGARNPGAAEVHRLGAYGIEPHEAPENEFPLQPSQKDGLGRMCKAHWNAYTAALARDAKARKAAASRGTGRAEVGRRS